MDVLKSQFEEDKEKIEKQFKENQVQDIELLFHNPPQFVSQLRIESSLQDKIASRRQRRARKNLEEKELEAFKGEKKEKKHKDKKDKKHKDKKHKDKKPKKDKHEDPEEENVRENELNDEGDE
jgi:hypothetical protein